MINVTILDYGIGNLMSVGRAFEYIGATVKITQDPKVAIEADRLILPGVGAFANAMASLRQAGFVDVIPHIIQKNRPLLGICLGMQMLFDTSEEFGHTEGLGLIPGVVQRLPDTRVDGTPHKLPHINWASLTPSDEHTAFSAPIMSGILPGAEFYFIHSFTAYLEEDYRVADTSYGGHRVAGVVQKDQVIGCQFHPEKSGPQGLHFLKNFLAI
jgi:glutamine amidotransferase